MAKMKAQKKARPTTAAFPLKFSFRLNVKQRRKLAAMSDPGAFLRECLDKVKKGGKK